MILMKIKDEKKLNKLFNQAKYEIELEGMNVSKENEQHIKAVLRGDLKRSDLIKMYQKG